MREYYISTEKSLLNSEKIWSLLQDCFWCKNIPVEYVTRFIKYSLCFGVYLQKTKELVGFGRVISDYTTYAYICDIVIDSAHRKKGLASDLFNEIYNHPELRGLKTWSLRCSEEARKIYERKGFTIVDNPNSLLEKNDLSIYSNTNFINLYKNNAYEQEKPSVMPNTTFGHDKD